MLRMKTNKRLHDLLRERGYSGSGLARCCGVKPAAFRQWMFKDKVPAAHIAALCRASGLEPRQLNPDFDELVSQFEPLVYYKKHGRWPDMDESKDAG